MEVATSDEIKVLSQKGYDIKVTIYYNLHLAKLFPLKRQDFFLYSIIK